MTEPDSGASSPVSADSREDKLRKDLGIEYYAILDVVTDYDRRLVTVKGWSVTLSLALLGLGFEKSHYALFGLAAFSAAAFWMIDALNKEFQMAYYSRMRDIEVAAYYLNKVPMPEFGEMSAPRIDWYWSYKGHRGADDPRYDKKYVGRHPIRTPSTGGTASRGGGRRPKSATCSVGRAGSCHSAGRRERTRPRGHRR
ncbi:hypothetical protein [Kribbella sp. VKM Ac-2568]|uniref:hypothetical protein n=1 Tax=Kribbella sp. VKM Ac-2568 TaxID=2512219 RepID=UPI00104ED08B|nr:hypothetical protein [Kribbella sp. VKM Ac-2568]TCM42760.1 hypothetical protein EV648_110301 [Kribbella sp. VKM Ac-2568]